jgi:hypothetical protein
MSEVQVSGHAQNNLYRSGYMQSLLGLDFCHIGGDARPDQIQGRVLSVRA